MYIKQKIHQERIGDKTHMKGIQFIFFLETYKKQNHVAKI